MGGWMEGCGELWPSYFFEILFFRTAFRADPILRQLVERGSRCNAVFRVSDFRVVHIPTGAFIFVHAASPFSIDEGRWENESHSSRW